MQYSVSEISQESVWEEFVQNRPEANFLQSWTWGEFQTALHKKVWHIALVSQLDNAIVGCALVVKEVAKRGTYFTIAGGPLLDWQDANAGDQFSTLMTEIKSLAHAEGAGFIRLRPQALDTAEMRQLMQRSGLVESPMHVTADLTIRLDITQTPDEILAQMRKSTRYEIRRCEKLGITVRMSEDADEIRQFYDHQLELAQKHGFVPFGYDFLYEQFRAFVAKKQVALFHSYQDGQLLASAFIIFYNREAVYHYGISTPENQKLPGSYACQWAAILEAQNRGCTHYNFWGIAPADQPQHRFAGVTLFKQGFGGAETAYVPAFDLPISIMYWPTRMFELARKKARKL